MKWRSTATTTSPPPSRILTRYCNCVTTIFCFTERHWNVANKDPNRRWLSVKSNFSRVTEITSTMERSQLSLPGKTKRYSKYTLILSFIAFSTTIYGLAIETECKSNPLPRPFFIWLLKRCCWFTIGNVLFVLFFWAVCREQHCWLLLTSYQSLFMRTHCIRTRETFLQETEFAKKGAANCNLPGENFLLSILKFIIKQSYWSPLFHIDICFNPLNAELNPICPLLALFGIHHILHVSRIRVNVMRISLLSTLFNLLRQVGVFRRFREIVKSDC